MRPRLFSMVWPGESEQVTPGCLGHSDVGVGGRIRALCDAFMTATEAGGASHLIARGRPLEVNCHTQVVGSAITGDHFSSDPAQSYGASKLP